MAIKRVPEPGQRRGIGLFGFLVIVGGVALLLQKTPHQETPPNSTPVTVKKVEAPDDPYAVTIDKTEKTVEARRKLLQKLLNRGVFTKITPRSFVVDVWVGPAFDLVDFADKQNFIGVVYAQYFSGTDFTNSVQLYNSKTGKNVGEFSTVGGGLKMY